MAGPFIVQSPSVTLSGSPIASNLITWQTATINETQGVADYLTTTNVNKRVNLLRSWTATLVGTLGTPISGATLGVTYATGYATLIESLGVTVTCEPKGYYTSSGSNNWMTFMPSTVRWNATYTALVDNDAPLIVVGADAAPAEAVFQIATSNTLTGDVLSSSLQQSIPIGDYSRVTYAVEGDDTLTAAGTNNIISAGAIAAMTPGTLTIKAHEVGTTDVQASGTAFWTSLSIQVQDSGLVNYTMQLQGSGALTRPDPAA